jgi:hypothetical protein
MMSKEDVERAIQSVRARFPADVRSWQIEIGNDATDTEAVWIWVTLSDEDLKDKTRNEIRGLLKEAIRNTVNPSIWVYVRFRATSEVEQA